MTAHSIKTDNANLNHKVYLRKQATQGFDELRVLDCFAGENKIWENFSCQKYYGIEKVKGKGKNLCADNERVIEALDLSPFNVIDLDSYGIPVTQMIKIFQNKTLNPGTVIVYTCIGNKMSACNKHLLGEFGLEKIYKKCKTLINGQTQELFYSFLYNRGIREVFEYQEESTLFKKKYGYFFVNS